MSINNPAYLALIENNTHSITYLNHLADISYTAAFSTFSLKSGQNLGLGVRYLGYGDFDWIDNRGEVIGDVNAYDAAFTINFSDTLAGFSYGFGVDIIRSAYADVSSTAFGFNAGLLYIDPSNMWTVAFTAHNVGGQLTNFTSNQFAIFAPENEPLPFDIRLGGSKKLEYLPLRLSLTLHSLHQFDLPVATEVESVSFIQNAFRHAVFSGEFLFSDNFNFRLGYDHYRHEQLKTEQQFDLAGVSFGFGLIIKDISIDFARNSWSEVGARTQLSLRRTF